MDSISIKNVKRGDIYWESEQGQDAVFLAISDARRADGGTEVLSLDILTGKPQRHWQHDRAGGYGLRLYTEPQCTHPNWPALLAALAKLRISSEHSQG